VVYKQHFYIKAASLHNDNVAKVLVMELSTAHISIVLSVVCMGVVFVGGWHLQSSLMEEQHHNDVQVDQLNKKINNLHAIVEHLLNGIGKVCKCTLLV